MFEILGKAIEEPEPEWEVVLDDSPTPSKRDLKISATLREILGAHIWILFWILILGSFFIAGAYILYHELRY